MLSCRPSPHLLHCRFYAHRGDFAATAHALRLSKSLRQRVWADSSQLCRQLPNVGRLISSRLAAVGLGTFSALQAADPRRVEAITQRHYPFGEPEICNGSYSSYRPCRPCHVSVHWGGPANSAPTAESEMVLRYEVSACEVSISQASLQTLWPPTCCA